MGSVETELESQGVYGLGGWVAPSSESPDLGMRGRAGNGLNIQNLNRN